MLLSSKIIQQTILQRDWEALRNTLGSLTNAEFRRAETMMRQTVLPQLDNALFWEALDELVRYRRQAFLACVVGAERLAKGGELSLECKGAEQLASWLAAYHPEACVKVADMLLPMMSTEAELAEVFEVFGPHDVRGQLALLMKLDSLHAYHLTFGLLKTIDDDKQLIRRCAIYIIRRNTPEALNMGSLLRAYFDLPDMPPACSMLVEPYELSRIDRSFDDFVHVIQGKRPVVVL